VGDMAIFMTSNGFTVEDIMKESGNHSFPESVVSFFRGDLGQPHGGFPKKLQKIILKGEKPYRNRPNAHLKPINFDLEYKAFHKKFDKSLTELDFLSYALYPKVYEDYYTRKQIFGEVTHIPTPAFFYGLRNNEEIIVEIGKGKSIIIKLLFVSEPDDEGIRRVSFELNGQTRRIEVKDAAYKSTKEVHRKAEVDTEIGAPLQGRISKVLVKRGQEVKENTPLFVIEAMKMETTVAAPFAGKVKKIVLSEGVMVAQDDLVVEMEG